MKRNQPGNSVAELLAANNGNFIANPLVGVEVIGHSSIILLDNDLGGLLDGLGTDATGDHFT